MKSCTTFRGGGGGGRFHSCHGPWGRESKSGIIASPTNTSPFWKERPYHSLKEMSPEFIKGEHKADIHRIKSPKVVGEKTVLFTLGQRPTLCS